MTAWLPLARSLSAKGVIMVNEVLNGLVNGAKTGLCPARKRKGRRDGRP
jgi:hypothetical protein